MRHLICILENYSIFYSKELSTLLPLEIQLLTSICIVLNSFFSCFISSANENSQNTQEMPDLAEIDFHTLFGET